MSKQIYIDSNGNEVLVSGTIINDNNLPHYTGTPTAGSTAEAINGQEQVSYTSATTGITTNSVTIIKKGRFLIFSIDIIFSTTYTNQWVTVLSIDTAMTMAIAVGFFGAINTEDGSATFAQVYQDADTIKLRVRSPQGNKNYRGQLVIPLDN